MEQKSNQLKGMDLELEQRIPRDLNIIEIMGDRILVEEDKTEQKHGNLYLPETAKGGEAPKMGMVIATGPGTESNPMRVKPGDRIVYGKYEGTDFFHQGKTYSICTMLGVMMILGPKEIG